MRLLHGASSRTGSHPACSAGISHENLAAGIPKRNFFNLSLEKRVQDAECCIPSSEECTVLRPRMLHMNSNDTTTQYVVSYQQPPCVLRSSSHPACSAAVATLRAPQQHEECNDGCVARLTCAYLVFIDTLCSKSLFIG